ncbi:MAG: hypothetical protein LVQ96_00565 [Thermoplasmatales archaeon]|nr:hypothetical protein [Thermoplasmatales archaeon]MCW6169650.1 hypothetical protein [Thermoplasmatales archaeon]
MVYNRVLDTLEELQLHGKTVFTINDASMLMKKPKKYVSKLLSSNRKVKRIERGLYFISSASGDNIYEIASQIVFPSYISLFAAFQYYSVTDQIIRKYSVISIKRHREINLGENIIEFRTLGKERFFGFNKVQNVYIASIEKAIIDSLYLNIPTFSYVKEAFELSRQNSKLNLKRLKEYADRMNSGNVNRKLPLLLHHEDESRMSEGD